MAERRVTRALGHAMVALALALATPVLSEPRMTMEPLVFSYRAAPDAAPVTLGARAWGTGPLVVMIASLGRGGSDFDDLGARLAAAGYRAVALDPRGIGASTGPAAADMRDYARDVAESVRRLAPDGRAVLIGHAFGNRVARATAAFHPEAVSSLILLASGGQVPIPPPAAKALRDVFDTSLSPAAHIAAVKMAFFAPGNDPEVWRDGWYPAVATAQGAALRASPAEEWTHAGGTPMLIVQAADDVIAPPANAEALRAVAPDSVDIAVLPRAGHAMLPEQPAAIAEIVLARLAQVAPR